MYRIIHDHNGVPNPGKGSSARRSWTAIALSAALLCWVAVANGAPLVFADTRAYFVGGEMAVGKAATLAAKLFTMVEDLSAGGAGTTEVPVRHAVGVRSAYYGLFVFLTQAAVSFWLTVALQALAVAYVARKLMAVAFPIITDAGFLTLMAGIALATSASWFASYLMPDIFAGVAIACVLLLGLYWEQLSRLDVLILSALLCFAITTHNTNVLLVAAGIGASLLAGIASHRPWKRLVASTATLAAALVLAVAAGILVGIVAFNKASLTPQSPPFLLARSIEDGPARHYLKASCPQAGYFMCRYVGELPTDSQTFLWAPDGIFMGVSTDDRDRMRAEEAAIVTSALLRYPSLQLAASWNNFFNQLVSFGVNDFDWGSSAQVSEFGFQAYPGQGGGAVQSGMHVLTYVTVTAGAALVLTLTLTGRLAGAGPLVFVLGVSILANAVICGVLSDPQPRYQARVVWLIPLVAGALLPTVIRRHSRDLSKAARAIHGRMA